MPSCDPNDDTVIVDVDACGNEVASESCDPDFACVDTDDEGMSIPAVCEDVCGADDAVEVCDPDNLGAVFYANECGEITGEARDCLGSTGCDDSGDLAVCGCPLLDSTTCAYTLPGLYHDSWVIQENYCGTTEVTEERTVETCGFGTRCHEDDDAGVEASCARSLTEEAIDSPYYDYSCSVFTEFVDFPTGLDADCRCRFSGDGINNGFPTSRFVDPINVTGVTEGIANCTPSSVWSTTPWPLDYGSGQSFRGFKTETAFSGDQMGGAFDPDTRELFSLMSWTSPNYATTGTVLSYNLDTGVRRIVSGVYPDPDNGYELTGSGDMSPPSRTTNETVAEQPLTGGSSLRRGSDGTLYVAGGGTGEGETSNYRIVSIDPTTGERDIIWQAQWYPSGGGSGGSGDITDDYGQCLRHGTQGGGINDSVWMSNSAFAVTDDGFYLAFDDSRSGTGVVHISSDRSTCEFVARWGARNSGGVTPADIGGGYDPSDTDLRGMLVHEGEIFVVQVLTNDLIAIDLETGDRRMVSNADDGVYTGIGYQNMFWDDTRDLLWAVGNHAPFTGSVIDITTGQRESIYADTEEFEDSPLMQSDYGFIRSVNTGMIGRGNGIHYGTVILDPEDNNKVWFTLEPAAMGVMELSTFNSMVMSW